MSLLEAASPLNDVGFANYDLAKLFTTDEDVRALRELSEDFADLPADSYATPHRYRRYSRGVIMPWEPETLTWTPGSQDTDFGRVTHYYQGYNNPEFPGVQRRFPTLHKRTEANSLLRKLVLFDFHETRWSELDAQLPLHVGVHMIKISVPRDGELGLSSPDVMHQDGEPYTFAHLIYRRNARGGVNSIATPAASGMRAEQLADDALLARFELREPLQSYGVVDQKVTHHVDAVSKGPGPEPGERAMVLIDFTPMLPRI